MALNLVVVEGRLTRNAELKYIGNTIVCNFSIAHNHYRKDNNGEWSTTVHYLDCAVFGGYAEAIAQRLIKGVPVIVQGRLKQDRWESSGETKSKISVLCNTVEFLPQNKKSEPDAPAEAPDFDAAEAGKIPF